MMIYSELGYYVQAGVVFIRCIEAPCYDLLVFVLSVVGLSRKRSDSPLKKCLYFQGTVYFAIAGLAYIPPLVRGPHGLPDPSLIGRVVSRFLRC